MVESSCDTQINTPTLDAIQANLQPDLQDMVRQFVALIGEIGDQLVPVATGALKRSRHAVFDDDGLGGGQAWGGGDVDYALYVHNGTVYMPARPWALMALIQAQAEFRDRVAARVGGSVQ